MAFTTEVDIAFPIDRKRDYSAGMVWKSADWEEEIDQVINAINQTKRLYNSDYIYGRNAAGTAYYSLLGLFSDDHVQVGNDSLGVHILGTAIESLPALVNAVKLMGNDTAGTAQDLIGINASNQVEVGDAGQALHLLGSSIGALPSITATLALARGTLTSDENVASATVTWNNAAVTFTAWKLNVTDTASAAASLPLDVQVNAASKFKVDKTGAGTFAAGITATTGTFSGAAVTVGTNPSNYGQGLGLPNANAGIISWRNAANTANMWYITTGSANELAFSRFTGGTAMLLDSSGNFNVDSGALFVSAADNGIVVNGSTLTSGYNLQVNGAALLSSASATSLIAKLEKTSSTVFTTDYDPILTLRSGAAVNDGVLMRWETNAIHNTFGIKKGTVNTVLSLNVTGGPIEALTISNLASVVVGQAALATTATDGFLYIPSSAGAPTGVPTAYTGRVPLHFDSTNNRIYIYNSGWKSVAVA